MRIGDSSKRKINNLYIIPGLIVGGAERQLVELLKGLNKSRFNPIVVCINKKGKGEFEEDVISLNIPIYYFKRKWRWDMSVIFKMLRLIKSKNIAIIHFWEMMSGFYGLIPAKVLGKLTVNSSIRDANPSISYRSIIKRFLFTFSDIIIANSKAGLLNYSINNHIGRVIYNGVDLKRFEKFASPKIIKQRLKICKGEKIVGIVANLTSKKDYYTFFKGCQHVLHKLKDVKFIVIGDGPKKDEYLRFAKLLGVTEKVLYLGKRTNIVDLINIFDVGVLCSYPEIGEGTSNSILEYMALRKPVVATDVGGTEEVIVDRITGFLVSPKNPEALAEKIIQLLENESLAKTMGLEGRKRIEKVFLLERMVRNFEEIYGEILENK
ncbi:glycosyltransferase [candidate division WOR-3 bacterium]|nr:glycosyltransferase [candidate division WOR-3 bacterium]